MATFGVTIFSAPSGGSVESADLSMKAEYKQLINSDGSHGQAKSYNTQYDFSARGKGDTCPATAGGSIEVSGASGKCIVTSAKQNSKNDDFQGWEVTATFYPHA